MHESTSDRPYAIFSSDGHAGADLMDYKPYLEKRWHDDFEDWAKTYSDAWGDIDTESEYRAGVSSFASPLNWDSTKRQEVLEGEGIVAEVLFPNTTPPFFPNGLLAAPGPRNRDEYERRWAGLKAHNRWTADFCSMLPGRRFGVAQLFIDDVDDAVEEVRWAREAGLAQVLLPSDHHLKLHNLYYKSLDPLWSVCEELDMPIGRHGAVGGSDIEPDSVDEAHACGVFETTYLGHRSLFQLVLGGVFERHPDLKFVFTELGATPWILPAMAALDGFCMGAKVDGAIVSMFAAAAVNKLTTLPSEQVRKNCYLGSIMLAEDIEKRYELGLDRFMWGADFPHHEGTVPYTLEALRATVGVMEERELRQVLAGNAAEVYGADVAMLQEVADGIGFTPEQVAKPLGAEETPADPNFHMFFVDHTKVFDGQA
jgi:predicted TIM-barrel fold metal-dependent hydrolase